MATSSTLKPVSSIATTAPDPTTQKLADLEARIAKLEGVLNIGSSGVVTLKIPPVNPALGNGGILGL